MLMVGFGTYSVSRLAGQLASEKLRKGYIEPMDKTVSKRVQVLKSRVVYRGPVFYVTSERVKEPTGVEVRRDIVRHPGSVVIMG